MLFGTTSSSAMILNHCKLVLYKSGLFMILFQITKVKRIPEYRAEKCISAFGTARSGHK